MTGPAWFPDVPPFPGAVAPVEISNNSGGTWAPYSGATVSHVGGPTGAQRFRRMFTVPPGVTQKIMRLSFAGDILDIPPNIQPQVHLDGGPALPEDPVFVYPGRGYVSFPVPAPGVHTLEIWVGQSAAIAGNTRLDLFSAVLVDPIPCGCCPVSLCGKGTPAAPAFFGQLTGANGRVAGPGANQFTFPNFLGSGVTAVVTCTGDTLAPGSQGAQVDVLAVGVSPPRLVHGNVTFSQPVYLRRFGLTDLDFAATDEQAGNFSPQRSGIYGAKVNQVCAATFPEATPARNPLGCVHDTAGGNNTGGVTFAGPLTSSLDFDVSRFNAGAGHFWTELGFDLLPPFPVFPCRTPDGVLHWYDENGTEIAATDVAPCNEDTPGAAAPIVVADLSLIGNFFGDGPNEYLCNIIPAPASFTGFTSVPPCLQPTVLAPTATWTNTASAEMDYGPATGVNGAVFIRWSSISKAGGNITWPGPYSVPLTPGQFRLSNPLSGGGRARFTYVSGFVGAGAPQFEPDTNNIRIHTGGPALPVIRYRLDFVP